MSEFMVPEVYAGVMIGVDCNAGFYWYPEEYEDLAHDHMSNLRDKDNASFEHGEGYFSRFTAPSYLDCTEWQGPYESEEEALVALWQDYDSDTISFRQWLRKYGIEEDA